jgi:hypothetical protein
MKKFRKFKLAAMLSIPLQAFYVGSSLAQNFQDEEYPIFYQPLPPEQTQVREQAPIAEPPIAPSRAVQQPHAEIGADREMVNRLVQFHSNQIGLDSEQSKKEAGNTRSSVQQSWDVRFTHAATRQEKLSLLQEAWNKSQDNSLTQEDRDYWHLSWQRRYQEEAKKSVIESSMPNPYEFDQKRGFSCTRIGSTVDCSPKN